MKPVGKYKSHDGNNNKKNIIEIHIPEYEEIDTESKGEFELNFNFDNPEDQELLDCVIENLSNQIEEGIDKLDLKMKDLFYTYKSSVTEIKPNLNYMTIARFNLQIVRDYVNCNYAFKEYRYDNNNVKFAVSRSTMQMLAKCDNLVDKVVSNVFTGAFKYEFAKSFMLSPEDYFENRFFTDSERELFFKKGKD